MAKLNIFKKKYIEKSTPKVTFNDTPKSDEILDSINEEHFGNVTVYDFIDKTIVDDCDGTNNE